MVNKYFLLILLFFLVIPPIQSAQPSVSIPSSAYGIQIEHPVSDEIPMDTLHKFHFHLFNITDGKPFTIRSNISCTFHLYNPAGSHILKVDDAVSSDDVYDWEQIVTGGNFTSIGQYSYVFHCNNSVIGGFYEHDFMVTPLGESLSTAQAIIYFIFLLSGIGLFILCLYYAIHIEWNHQRDEDGFVLQVNDLKYVKIIMVVMCYILILFLAGLMRGITANYLPTVQAYKFFEWIYWIMMSLLYPVMIASVTLLLIAFLNNKKLHDAINRGIQA